MATPVKPLSAQMCSRREQSLAKTYPILTLDPSSNHTPRDIGVLTCGKTTPSSFRTSGYRGCRSYWIVCARCIVAFIMGESVIRSLCQPEIGTQKGVSITVLMATVRFKLRRWCQHYHLTSSKWDMTSQMHVTSLKHADIRYDVRRQTSCTEMSMWHTAGRENP